MRYRTPGQILHSARVVHQCTVCRHGWASSLRRAASRQLSRQVSRSIMDTRLPSTMCSQKCRRGSPQQPSNVSQDSGVSCGFRPDTSADYTKNCCMFRWICSGLSQFCPGILFPGAPGLQFLQCPRSGLSACHAPRTHPWIRCWRSTDEKRFRLGAGLLSNLKGLQSIQHGHPFRLANFT
jgi:hypothetical protein